VVVYDAYGTMAKHDHDPVGSLPEDVIPPEQTDDGDVDVPAELEQWEEDTRGVERIIGVAITITKPRTAEWIADQALVSEPTAREHLQTFSGLGVIASYTSSGVTRYHADAGYLHYQKVSALAKDHSKDELLDQAEEVKQRIEAIQSEYDVDRPDELRAKATSDDATVEDVREYKKTASELARLQDRCDVLHDAIERFEKFTTSVAHS
jgi:predicted ArsR family transcriptional regulator